MNLLVAVDLSEASERVLAAAAQVAHFTAAHAYLVHVVPDDPAFIGYEAGPESVRQSVAAELRDEHRALQEYAEAMRARGLNVTALLVQGYTVDMLLREADRLEATVIVCGSHGRGAMYDLLIGSVSEALIRRSTCPVLVVPTRPKAPIREASD